MTAIWIWYRHSHKTPLTALVPKFARAEPLCQKYVESGEKVEGERVPAVAALVTAKDHVPFIQLYIK